MGWVFNATPEQEAESSWENIFVASVLLTPLMTLVVSLRVWSRWRILAAEDLVVVFAAVSHISSLLVDALVDPFAQICSICYVALSIMR